MARGGFPGMGGGNMQQMIKQFTQGRGGKLGGRMHGFGRKKRLK